MFPEIGGDGLHGVSPDQVVLLQMWDGIQSFLQAEQGVEVGLVIRRHGKGTVNASAPLAVLCPDAGKTLKGIEPDDLAVAVEWLEDAPEGGHEGKCQPPAHAEFHDDAVVMEDLPVDLVEEEDPGEGLRRQEESHVGQDFIVRQGRRLDVIYEGLQGLLLVAARQDDRIVFFRLYIFQSFALSYNYLFKNTFPDLTRSRQ